MREIKFRAWNEKLQKFFYFKNGRYFSDAKCKICISERICSEFIWKNAEQFTGLHDRNGVEIYEGDVVEIIDTGEKSTHTVKYFDGIDYPAFDTHPQLDIDCNALAWAVSYPDCEIFVIGNTHENTELLEGK